MYRYDLEIFGANRLADSHREALVFVFAAIEGLLASVQHLLERTVVDFLDAPHEALVEAGVFLRLVTIIPAFLVVALDGIMTCVVSAAGRDDRQLRKAHKGQNCDCCDSALVGASHVVTCL